MSEVRLAYSYDSVPTVAEFALSTKFIKGIVGPWGSGKSSGCVMQVIRNGSEQLPWSDGKRRARFAVIRNTFPQLEDTTIKTFHDWLPPRLFGDWQVSKHRYVIDRLSKDLEIEILFRALDRPDHVANLLSLELTSAWINEAREVPWAIVKAAQGRVGRYPPVREVTPINPCVMMDTNYPDDESWWYDLFEVKKPPNAQLFRQPGGRSPNAENLPNLIPGYYENLVQSLDEDEIRVYVDAQYGYVRDGKPVYPEYNDGVHCQEFEPMEGVTVHRGWDFGLTPACVLSQLTPEGIWKTFDELVADDLDIGTFSDTVLDHCATRWPQLTKYEDVGDPAGMQRSAMARPTEARSCFDILHGKGIMIVPGEQTITVRTGSVRRALTTMRDGKPGLVIHPRCKVLRGGYRGKYRYRRIRISGHEARYFDTPEKNSYSHPHDANQYVAAKLFGAVLRGREERKQQARNQTLLLVSGGHNAWMG